MARPSQAEKMAPRCAAMREVLHRWTNAEEILPIWDQLTAQVSDERDKASRARTAGDWRRAKQLRLRASAHERRNVLAMEMLEEMRQEKAEVSA